MLIDEVATKTGNRLEAKQCLELAAQGKIKARYTLRRLEDLTEVSFCFFGEVLFHS